MRPKTKRRLVILVAATGLIVGSAGGFYVFRQHQIEGRIMTAKAAGLEAVQHKDYNTALKQLSYYNERRQRDAVTLFAFAEARRRVETPNYRHLAEAIAFYRRGLEAPPPAGKNPDEIKKMYDEAKHALLDLYANPYVGYNAEAVALADQLLAANENDVAALRAKAQVLYRLHKLDEALAASEKLNQALAKLNQVDVADQRLTYELMYMLKKPGAEILKRAQEARKANPDDPRLQMLEGYALMLNGQIPEATDRLLASGGLEKDLSKKMAGPSIDDPKFVGELCGMLDALRMYEYTNRLLELSAAKSNDPETRRMLVQRLWQSGKIDDVAARLASEPLANGDSQLLAYRAMCLFQGNKAADARPIVDALASRKDDDAALAWSKALRAAFDSPNMTAGQQIVEYQSALGRDPYNPVIRYMMGEAYARLGETEPALQHWRMVADAVPSWATPRTQIARLLADTGRPQLAVQEAAAAYNRAQNAGSAIGLAVAWAAQADRLDDPQVAKQVLTLVTDIQTKIPNEPETLPVYAALLARTGQTEQAAKVIRGALATDLKLPEDTFLRLAGVSRAMKLGAQKDLFARSEALHGLTPALATARAIDGAADGHAPEALAELRKQADEALAALRKQADEASEPRKQAPATKGQPTDWKLAVARFMQATNDAGAKDAWTKLGEENPNDLAIQAAISDLSEDSAVWQDRAFIDRTIQRLRSLTGDEGHRWQMARARWLLTSGKSERDSAEAVVLLTDLVRTSPGMIAPRVYLATALKNVRQVPQAIEQLKGAAEIDRDNAGIALMLADMLQADGRFDEAADYLARANRSRTMTASERAHAAALMARGGDTDDAIKALQAGAAANPAAANDPARQALLAALLRRKGQFAEAEKLYEELLKNPNADPNAVVDAADFYAIRGNMDAARAAMAKLDQLKTAPGKFAPEQKAILVADFEERHGNADEKADALKRLQQATADAPASVEAWAQLTGYQLRQKDFAQALATADKGIKAAGENTRLAFLKAAAGKLQVLGDQPELAPLIQAVSRSPKDQEAQACTDTLNDLVDLKNGGAPADQAATRLQVNADRYPRFMPAQKLAMNTLLKVKPARHDDEVKIANRCVTVFPNDPDAAEMATVAYLRGGRWSEMLSAAEEWKLRSGDHPMRPDLAIAEARMQMAQPGKALETLKDYLEPALKNPKDGALVLSAYCRALILDGQEKKAKEILTPLLPTDPQWRGVGLRLAGSVRGADTARDWIKDVSATIPQGAFAEQQSLAAAWYALGVRYGVAPAFVSARQILDGLATNKEAKVGTFILLAATCEKQDDHDGAIAAYRKALALEPNLPEAQNNLAFQLFQASKNGENLAEAKQLAEKAIASNTSDPSYQDTLAQILVRTGDRAGAIRTYETIVQLQPNNLEANIALARTLVADGKRDNATRVMDRIESLVRSDPAANVTYRDELSSLRKSLGAQ